MSRTLLFGARNWAAFSFATFVTLSFAAACESGLDQESAARPAADLFVNSAPLQPENISIALVTLDRDHGTATNTRDRGALGGSTTGGGTLFGVTNANITGGTASFSGLSIDMVGADYVLTAGSTGLFSGLTNPFDVTAATEDEPYELVIRVGGVLLETTPELIFFCPPIEDEGVSFFAQPSRVDADGHRASTLQVELLDACGNPAFGRAIGLEVLGEIAAVLSETSVMTIDMPGDDLDGTASVEATSEEPGELGLVVTVDGDSFESAPDLVTFLRIPVPPRITYPADGDILNDDTPTIEGTGEPDITVIITIDGEEVGSAEVDENGMWAFTPEEPLDEGERTLTVRPEDDGDERSHTITIEIVLEEETPSYRVSGGGCTCSVNTGVDGGTRAPLLFPALLMLGLAFLRRRHGRVKRSDGRRCRKRNLLVACLLILFFMPAVARAAPETDMVIDLETSGLNKTRQSTVERIVGIDYPIPKEELDIEQIKERLLRSGLFVKDMTIELVAIEEEANGAGQTAEMPEELAERRKSLNLFTLQLELEERWSLIPLPAAGYFDGSWLGGFSFVDVNFIGTGTLVVIAAVFQGEGGSMERWAALLGAQGGVLQFNQTEVSPFVSYTKGEEELQYAHSDPEKRVYSRYPYTELGARLQLTRKINASTSLGATGNLSIYEIDQEWDDAIDPPDSTSYYIQGLSLGVDKTQTKSFFRAGLSGRLRYRHGFPLDGGDHFNVVRLDGSYEMPVFGNHKLLLSMSADWGTQPITEHYSNTGTGFRVLPAGRSKSNRSAAVTLEYELPVYSTGWGEATGFVFADGGFYYPNDEMHSFVGPGGGGRVYLARIAVPALGLNLGYNLLEERWFMSAALGATF